MIKYRHMEDEFMIWTEKYRPKKFNEIIGQERTIERIKNIIETGNLPNLLFTGPAGVGKSTTALVIAKELYGEDWRQNFMELNASDARGIDVMRSKNEQKDNSRKSSLPSIKDFAKVMPINANFKLIFLDEADALTPEAQNALRRTMERYASTTRFILSCNYVSKLIPPIVSRCVMFSFKPLEFKDIEKLAKKISKDENFKIEKDAEERLYQITKGDCRQAVNILQSAASITRDLKKEDIEEMSTMANSEAIKDILELALDGQFIPARDKLLNTMYANGLSGFDIIKEIVAQIQKLDVDNMKKLRLIERAGEIEFRIVEGSDEYLQLESFLAGIALLK